MLKLFKGVKVILIFIIFSVIGAIILFYVEPIIFQESNLEPIVQVLVTLGLFFVFLGGLIHSYFRNRIKSSK